MLAVHCIFNDEIYRKYVLKISLVLFIRFKTEGSSWLMRSTIKKKNDLEYRIDVLIQNSFNHLTHFDGPVNQNIQYALFDCLFLILILYFGSFLMRFITLSVLRHHTKKN